MDAVNELAKISGYPIQVNGDRTLLADKKITLDTGRGEFLGSGSISFARAAASARAWWAGR